MIIRPVSDLRNKYAEIESELRESGAIYLTKNGYGTAVILAVEEYDRLTGNNNLPIVKKKGSSRKDRGFLNSYANPDLRLLEKDAGRMYAFKNHKESTNE